MRRRQRQCGGFTLIELMMVIAIMCILSSWASFGYAGIMAKVRDRRRFVDLHTFYLAVMQFKNDHDNIAPITRCAGSDNWAAFDSPDYMNFPICTTPDGPIVYPNIATALAPYLSKPLADPKRANDNKAGYKYRSDDGVDFTIKIYVSVENMNNFPQQYWAENPWNPTYPCYSCCAMLGEPDANGQCSINTIMMRTADSPYFQ